MTRTNRRWLSLSKFAMFAIPPKADIAKRCWDVRFVPLADIESVGDTRVALTSCGESVCLQSVREFAAIAA
jgi:hypothetical protein